jgi:NAD+ synthase (glutamine-hydrolysing)
MPGQLAIRAPLWQQMLLCPWEHSLGTELLSYETQAVERSPWAGPWESFAPRRFLDLNEMVRRFLARAKISRVVVGVSGGIDSSTTAAFFTRLLGPRQVLAVGMPGIYNTRTTQEQARELVENLGCWYAEVPVADSVDWTRRQIQGLGIVRPGEQSEIRLSDFDFENVTARDRGGRVLAALASGFGGVFAATGNKAELAVGYCTLYGDLAGFLAPLGDLWKGEVYALAQYLNEVEFCGNVIPAGAFSVHPSAELSVEQNPERGGGDPLVYWYHDYLLRYWVEQSGTPEDVLRAYLSGTVDELLGLQIKLQGHFKSAELFVQDLERWWGAYQGIAVAKRMQAPPVVDLSGRHFSEGAAESLAPPYYGRVYADLRAKALGGKRKA